MATTMQGDNTARPIGYSTTDRFFASRFKQGGRTVYQLDLSPLQLISLITRPDPTRPVESNREIRAKHAQDFADYFRNYREWVIPGIILRSPKHFSFEMHTDVSGTQFGILEVSRTDARGINILDGQHRILGFFLAADDISADLEKAREHLQRVNRTELGGAAPRDARRAIAELEEQLKRLDTERLSIQLYVEADPHAYRQMFFDISDNALGITASVRARFDSRSVVNRALPAVLEHPLLAGRTEMEVDRVGRKSNEFLAAKNVVEIIRSVAVGFSGRIGRRWNADASEAAIAKDALGFFDALTEAFPPLKAVEIGQVLPRVLRQNSLLGGSAFLRILAGVYHQLQLPTVHGWSRDQVVEFFKKLAPHVTNDGSPVYPGSIWLERMPDGAFEPGALAPVGRRQNLELVLKTLIDWALDREEFLNEAPAPKPEPLPELTEDDMLLAAEEAAARREAREASVV